MERKEVRHAHRRLPCAFASFDHPCLCLGVRPPLPFFRFAARAFAFRPGRVGGGSTHALSFHLHSAGAVPINAGSLYIHDHGMHVGVPSNAGVWVIVRSPRRGDDHWMKQQRIQESQSGAASFLCHNARDRFHAALSLFPDPFTVPCSVNQRTVLFD
jgi:hypothetical protein